MLLLLLESFLHFLERWELQLLLLYLISLLRLRLLLLLLLVFCLDLHLLDLRLVRRHWLYAALVATAGC